MHSSRRAEGYIICAWERNTNLYLTANTTTKSELAMIATTIFVLDIWVKLRAKT